jgi:hypothetical protein
MLLVKQSPPNGATNMNLNLNIAKLTVALVPFVVTGAMMVSTAAADPGASGAHTGSPGVLSGNVVAPITFEALVS